MSWESGDYTFDYSMSKDKINNEVFDLLANQNPCYEYEGSWQSIKFVDGTVYKSEEDAEEAILSRKSNDRDNIAVPYWDFDKAVSEKTKIKEADERIKAAHNRLEKAMSERYLPTLTSRYITCRTCGSSLSREYLLKKESGYWAQGYDRCPICDGDLRPESTKTRIESLRKSYEKAKATRKELEVKITDKLMKNPEKYGKKKWFVTASIYVG